MGKAARIWRRSIPCTYGGQGVSPTVRNGVSTRLTHRITNGVIRPGSEVPSKGDGPTASPKARPTPAPTVDASVTTPSGNRGDPCPRQSSRQGAWVDSCQHAAQGVCGLSCPFLYT